MRLQIIDQLQKRASTFTAEQLTLEYPLRHGFRHLGRIIGHRPLTTILLSLILTAICALGAARFKIVENMKTGYIPTDSPSRKEFEIYEQFFSGHGLPYYTGIFIKAKDWGNLMREEYFDEIERINDVVMNELNVTFDAKTYRFNELCGVYCASNQPLFYFKDSLESRRTKLLSNQSLSPNTNLTYPISTIAGFSFNMAPNLYKIQLTSNHSDLSPTNIQSVSLMVLWYRSDLNQGDTMQILSQWELALFDYILSYKSDLVELIPYGESMVNAEILRGGLGVVPYYCFGFLLMLVFMVVTVALSALYHSQMDSSKIVVAVAAVVSPLLAIITTFGSLSLMGFHTNVMMLIAPFLVLAIGVDDAFLLIHSWQRVNMHQEGRTKDVAERMSVVFEEIGPSIMITSVTNSVAFLIGTLTSPPEIALFCGCVSLAMAVDFLFELIFFAPMLAFCAKKQTTPKPINNDSPNKIASLLGGSSRFMEGYLGFLVSRWGKATALLLWSGYMVLSVHGILHLRPEMDPENLLPDDSLLVETLHLRRTYVWAEYHPISVIVNHKLDLNDKYMYGELEKMIGEMETLPDSFGASVTRFWLRDYMQFHEMQMGLSALWDFGIFEEEEIDFELLPHFLALPQYRHWNESVHWSSVNGTVRVNSFTLSFAYRNIRSLGYRARVMLQWRDIIARYSHLNISLWDPDAPFSDIILSVGKVTTRTLLITLGSMAGVCLLFVPNLASVIIATAAIASICTGVIGFLSWWGANLDPITMADMIMAIGFSVDYTAHVSYHYYKSCTHAGSNKERLSITMRSVAWPSLQAALSTMICMGPQSFSPMPAHLTFVKTVVIVSLWGLLHGLFFMPVLLSSLPARVTGVGIFCSKIGGKVPEDLQMQKV